MTRLAVALVLLGSLPAMGQSYRYGGYPYHAGGYGGYAAGGYEVRSYQYQTYGGYSSDYVGRRSIGAYYPNATARYHYTAPRITTGQGFVNRGYGYRSVGRGYYSRSGYGSAVPRYYGR